jgi:hypothetical protein
MYEQKHTGLLLVTVSHMCIMERGNPQMQNTSKYIGRSVQGYKHEVTLSRLEQH